MGSTPIACTPAWWNQLSSVFENYIGIMHGPILHSLSLASGTNMERMIDSNQEGPGQSHMSHPAAPIICGIVVEYAKVH